jgi:hypothetical protein
MDAAAAAMEAAAIRAGLVPLGSLFVGEGETVTSTRSLYSLVNSPPPRGPCSVMSVRSLASQLCILVHIGDEHSIAV